MDKCLLLSGRVHNVDVGGWCSEGGRHGGKESYERDGELHFVNGMLEIDRRFFQSNVLILNVLRENSGRRG